VVEREAVALEPGGVEPVDREPFVEVRAMPGDQLVERRAGLRAGVARRRACFARGDQVEGLELALKQDAAGTAFAERRAAGGGP
jgi:hypothetical protein